MPTTSKPVHAISATSGRLTVCGIEIPRDRRTKAYRALVIVTCDALVRVDCPACRAGMTK